MCINQLGVGLGRSVNFILKLLIVGAATCGVASAQQGRTGGPTPSAEGAAVYFVGLNDGATVPTRITIRFGLHEMGVAPAGLDRSNLGHHHLLIDTELPALDKPIPNDFNHLHFGAGQTEAEITLKPGTHTLQLLLGGQGSHSAQPAGHVASHSSRRDGARASESDCPAGPETQAHATKSSLTSPCTISPREHEFAPNGQERAPLSAVLKAQEEELGAGCVPCKALPPGRQCARSA
jgi:Domain of unknown function (DUF4399)